MNLHTLLARRAESGRPVRVGLIGAGKFGSMVLAQAQRIAGFHVVGVADLDVGKARASLARVGWPAERYARPPPSNDAMRTGGTCVLDDAHGFGCRTPASNASSRPPGTPSPVSATAWPQSKAASTW